MAYNPGGQPPYNPQNPYNAAPPLPPPKSGMGTGAKVAIFGCLGVIVLCVIAAIVVAIVVMVANKNANTVSYGNSNDRSTTSTNSNSSSSGSSSNRNSGTSSTSGVSIDSLELKRDQNGKAGETVETFKPTDNPMHFVIGLSEFESGTKVKVVLMAVSVDSGERDVKVGEIERVTGTLENQMDATMTLPRNWPTGTYRVDIYINNNLTKSQEFQVAN